VNNWFTRMVVATSCAGCFMISGTFAELSNWYIWFPVCMAGYYLMDLYAWMKNET